GPDHPTPGSRTESRSPRRCPARPPRALRGRRRRRPAARSSTSPWAGNVARPAGGRPGARITLHPVTGGPMANQFVVELKNEPGGMARLSRELADAGVNIYGHLFLGRWGDRAMFAFVVDNPDQARPILERKG